MDLGLSPRGRALRDAVAAMAAEVIAPLDAEFHAETGGTGNRWEHTPRQTEILEGLKAEARSRDLWNLWRTHLPGGPGITTVDYAWIAEEMGRSWLAPEVFNCNAPDTGNMEGLRPLRHRRDEGALARAADGGARSARPT